MGEQNRAITEAQGHRNLLILLFAGFVLSVITGFTVGQAGAVATRRHVRDHTHTLDSTLTALKLTPEQRLLKMRSAALGALALRAALKHDRDGH